MADAELFRVGDAIDHLISAPMANWTILKGIPLNRLYTAAREHAGGPLTLAAAELLLQRVRPGDRVLVLSGFIIRDYQRPETDGPIGAAVLARALALGLGAVPVGVGEEAAVGVLSACFAAAGLIPGSLAELDSGRNRCAVVTFPVQADDAERAADELLDALRPAAVIAVERPGGNAMGHYHGGGGFSISAFTAKTDVLFAKARERGIATIGIGDLGNELGMGAIADHVRRWVPHGDVCLCPCGGGIAASLPADVAVVATISNWGAYGVAACLAAALGKEAAFHDRDLELRLIDACVAAGAVDPVVGQLRPSVDGTEARTNAAIVDLLRSVVLLWARGAGEIQEYRESWAKHAYQP